VTRKIATESDITNLQILINIAMMLGFAFLFSRKAGVSYLVGWVEIRNPTSLERAQPNLLALVTLT